MTKIAHITNRPDHEVGDRVLGLCGEEFKVKTLWADLPVEKPICRPCVDNALAALTESDKLIEQVRVRIALLNSRTAVVHELLGENLILDEIVETDLAFQDEIAQRQRDKAARKLAKKTCTCTWTSQEMFEVDPNCPIHGPAKAEELLGELDALPVEVPDAPTPGSVQRNGDQEV